MIAQIWLFYLFLHVHIFRMLPIDAMNFDSNNVNNSTNYIEKSTTEILTTIFRCSRCVLIVEFWFAFFPSASQSYVICITFIFCFYELLFDRKTVVIRRVSGHDGHDRHESTKCAFSKWLVHDLQSLFAQCGRRFNTFDLPERFWCFRMGLVRRWSESINWHWEFFRMSSKPFSWSALHTELSGAAICRSTSRFRMSWSEIHFIRIT